MTVIVYKYVLKPVSFTEENITVCNNPSCWNDNVSTIEYSKLLSMLKQFLYLMQNRQ